jgi:hypothetical protein
VAGTGTAGNSGDDGPATDAELNNPTAVAVNADGGFLIADPVSNEVRKVSALVPIYPGKCSRRSVVTEYCDRSASSARHGR